MSFTEIGTDFKISADQLVRDDSIAEEFVCKICLVHVVGCGPQLTKCSHLFCGDCLQQWFDTHPSNQTWAQRAQTAGAVPCPVCKTMLRKESDIYPVEKNGSRNSAALWRMLQGLRIKCGAQNGCCNWVGECGSYLDHLQCGKCGDVEGPGEDHFQKGEPAIGLDDPLKERPSSPSTCSEISGALDVEASNTDHSLDEVNVEEESEGENYPAPEPLHSEDGVGQDLTALINDLIQLEAKDIASVPVDLTETESSFKSDVKPNMCSPKEPKNKNCSKGNKSKQQKAKGDAAFCSKKSGRCLTPQEVQAHQWQAAQYQMAYAQQYQMAVQAFRMQQYYQQARMVAGGSF